MFLDHAQIHDWTARADRVFFGVGPLGLSALISARDLETIESRRGGVVVLSLHMLWSDQGPELYAFSDPVRRDLFRALGLIHGIGPASAQAVVGSGRTIDILRAAAGRDRSFFTRMPGIADKRASQLISEIERARVVNLPAALPVPVCLFVEAREALESRGLSSDAAEDALMVVLSRGVTIRDAAALLAQAEESP